jgi:hypothetical protein
MLLSAVPELHKKWQHTPLGPVAVAPNGSAVAADVLESTPNGHVAQALAQVSMMDEMSHTERVVKRDLRSRLGGANAAATSKSSVAVALEPPALHEFEPDHLVAEPE